jgi:hypothetical protein
LLGVLVGTEVPLWLPLLSVITLVTLAPYGIDVAALQHLPPITGHP